MALRSNICASRLFRVRGVNPAEQVAAVEMPTRNLAQSVRQYRFFLRSRGRLRRSANDGDALKKATSLTYLAKLSLRSVRLDKCRLANDGGGAAETALRPNLSRSLVFLPYGRPTLPGKKPMRHRQRSAWPNLFAMIGQLPPKNIHGALPTWLILQVFRPLRVVCS